MSESPDHSVLNQRVRAVWRRIQWRDLITGLLVWCRWAVALFFLYVVVDWALELPMVARVASLLIVLGVSTWRAWRSGWRSLRLFDATRTALRIESQHGDLGSLLVTAIQFQQADSVPGSSDAFRAEARRQAEAVAVDLRVDDLVTLGPLRPPALIAAVLACLIGGFALVNGPFLLVGVARLFNPWVTDAYPTRTRLELLDGNLVVKEGDSATITARVSGVIPKKARLELRTGAGQPRRIELSITDGRCEHGLDAAYRDFSYRIKAGDARSDWQQVRVIAAPTVDRAVVTLNYPAYLQRDPQTVEALTLTAPEGTRARWQLTLDRPISTAVLHRDGVEPMPLEVSESGLEVSIEQVVTASVGYHIAWVDRDHGFDFASPRYFLQVAADRPPRIELTAPAGNLMAMLGRRVDLVARAHDDHGITDTRIVYRINQTPEQSLTSPTSLRHDRGEQAINWDYRKAMPDLNIGDTVSFIVEVSDAYPGPAGPHRVRSEVRRITFLSEQEYLEQVGKQQDRLLSRVRALYRQQRAAHELVLAMDQRDESFAQSCQLEAVRQEMLREQLTKTADEVQGMLDDLAANHVVDAVERDALVYVKTDLQRIAGSRVADAAGLLRKQAGAITSRGPAAADPGPAARMVDIAARELGSLVARRDIQSASEVFAREAHALAKIQAALRQRSLTASNESNPPTLAAQQRELAGWTSDLLTDLRGTMRYTERPLAVVRLSRLIRQLQDTDVAGRMSNIAAQIDRGDADHTAATHNDIIEALLEAEFMARGGAEIAMLDEVRSMLEAQARLLRQAGNDADAAVEIRQKLLRSPLPRVPAATPQVFDTALPKPPPMRALLARAEQSLADPINTAAAEGALTEMVAAIDHRIEQLAMQTEGAVRLASRAFERLERLREFDTRQLRLLEQTLDAGDGELGPLVEPQRFLAEEVLRFRRAVLAENQRLLSFARKDALPLAANLERVEGEMHKATQALRDSRLEDAAVAQEAAAALIARGIAQTEAVQTRLDTVSSMRLFQRDVRFAGDALTDIVDEQRAALAATEAGKPDDLPKLAPVLRNISAAAAEVAPVLDVVATRVDAGTALLFAASDIDDAVFAAEASDQAEASDAQSIAADSLEGVQTLIGAVATESGYVAEIVEFLYGALSDSALLASRQQRVRLQLADGDAPFAAALIADQQALRRDSLAYVSRLQQATGLTEYTNAVRHVSDAFAALQADDAAAAGEAMGLAEAALAGHADQLLNVMKLLRELPASTVSLDTPAELLLLIDALAMASEHRAMTRRTHDAGGGQLADLAEQQRQLASRCGGLLRTDPPHPLLVAAGAQTAEAAAALAAGSRDAATESQRAADESLRHFIVEQTLQIIELTAPPPPSPIPADSTEPSEVDDLLESTSGIVSGELPTDKEVEWEVLGRRSRAALTENFARELPLEYRGMLKNYYERLAQ